jgi:hypothetical protein
VLERAADEGGDSRCPGAPPRVSRPGRCPGPQGLGLIEMLDVLRGRAGCRRPPRLTQREPVEGTPFGQEAEPTEPHSSPVPRHPPGSPASGRRASRSGAATGASSTTDEPTMPEVRVTYQSYDPSSIPEVKPCAFPGDFLCTLVVPGPDLDKYKGW